MSALRVRELSEPDVAARADELAAFEHRFDYPLGTDRFRIDHGRDYLAFFRALGAPRVLVAEAAGRIVGVLVAVRRRLAGHDAWYLCDLKADAAGGTTQRLVAAWAAGIARDEPFFGVSMDPADGVNRFARAARRRSPFGALAETPLAVFSLDHDTWRRVEPVLAAALGPTSLCSNAGVKDIVLLSTGEPLPLLHVQHGPLAREPRVAPRAGAVHMLALPARDALVARLAESGVRTDTTATVLHRHMDGFDWRWLSTADV